MERCHVEMHGCVINKELPHSESLTNQNHKTSSELKRFEETAKEEEEEEEEMADEGKANCVDILLAILLPPLGVFLKFGCQAEFWICLVLTFFGYIPGIIYAVYAITK